MSSGRGSTSRSSGGAELKLGTGKAGVLMWRWGPSRNHRRASLDILLRISSRAASILNPIVVERSLS
eukprot:5795546-Pyramimonas_sp.AAC.1